MIKKILISLGLCGVIVLAQAQMQPLSDGDMNTITGGAGADLELDLRLNQTTAGPTADTPAAAQTAARAARSICSVSDPLKCRLAFAINHEDVNSRLWLVLKGLSGGVYIPKLTIDGTDVVVVNGSSANSALKLGFGSGVATEKIRINNLGFQALSIAGYDSTGGTAGLGYRDSPIYSSTYATGGAIGQSVAAFDNGKETGILGLNINGSVSITGSMLIFACGSSHPRCG